MDSRRELLEAHLLRMGNRGRDLTFLPAVFGLFPKVHGGAEGGQIPKRTEENSKANQGSHIELPLQVQSPEYFIPKEGNKGSPIVIEMQPNNDEKQVAEYGVYGYPLFLVEPPKCPIRPMGNPSRWGNIENDTGSGIHNKGNGDQKCRHSPELECFSLLLCHNSLPDLFPKNPVFSPRLWSFCRGVVFPLSESNGYAKTGNCLEVADIT